MSSSKPLNRTLLILVILSAGNCLAQNEPAAPFPQGATVVTPHERASTDVDRIIRDFVHLLYPSWDNGAWDLVIEGRRSMNPNFGVDAWSFAVLDAAQPTVSAFYPSALPCHSPGDCFSQPDLSKTRFVGRINQRGTRIQAYEGSRPNVAQKNADFQQGIHPDSSLKDLQSLLEAANSRYPPSRERDIRKHLETELIFASYGLRIRSLQFCRSVGQSDNRRVAAYWSAHVFSGRFHQSYVLTVEPFEGDITGLLALNIKDAAKVSCTP
jgi:hypothetical protein